MIISFQTRVTTYHRDHHVTTTYTKFTEQIYINGNFHVTDQTSTATDQKYSYASHIAWTYHVHRLDDDGTLAQSVIRGTVAHERDVIGIKKDSVDKIQTNIFSNHNSTGIIHLHFVPCYTKLII
jgi:hypothetical protein